MFFHLYIETIINIYSPCISRTFSKWFALCQVNLLKPDSEPKVITFTPPNGDEKG